MAANSIFPVALYLKNDALGKVLILSNQWIIPCRFDPSLPIVHIDCYLLIDLAVIQEKISVYAQLKVKINCTITSNIKKFIFQVTNDYRQFNTLLDYIERIGILLHLFILGQLIDTSEDRRCTS